MQQLTVAVTALFIMLFATALPARAGGPDPEEDILRPVPYRMTLGGFAGAALNLSSGSFSTLCDCEYRSGDGVDILFGAIADYPLNDVVSVSAALYYEGLGTSYEKNVRRYMYHESEDAIVPVDYALDTDVRAGYVSLELAARLRTGLGGLLVHAGPSLGYLVTDNIHERERILTPGVVYDSGGGTEQTMMDGGLDRYYDPVRLRFALVGGISYDIPLEGNMILAPGVSVAVPLTPMVREHGSWRIYSLRGTVALRFGL